VERDLGVMIQDNLKVSEQCSKPANTVNKMLDMMNVTCSQKLRLLVDTIYKSLVGSQSTPLRTGLEAYSIQTDIDLLDKYNVLK